MRETRDLRDVLLLTAIVLGLVAANYVWLSQNRVPPHWDLANHMLSALKYQDVLSSCFTTAHGIVRGLVHCERDVAYVDRAVYPPLFPLSAGVMAYVTGSSATALGLANVPYIVLLIASMYVLGRRMHSGTAGVLAAMLVCAYPLMFSTSHEVMLELSLMAFTAAAGALLLTSEHFRSRPATLLFGVVSGLALLVKFTYVTFIAGPLLLVCVWLAADAWQGTVSWPEVSRRSMWVLAAGVVAAGLAALWYVPNLENFVDRMQSITALDTTGQSRLAVSSLFFYVTSMVADQMGIPLFLLFIFGLIELRGFPGPNRVFLLVWMISIYVICSMAIFKAMHNDIGILIPAALISAIGVARLSAWKPVLIGAVTAVCWLQIATFALPEHVLAARIGTCGWRQASPAFPQHETWEFERVLRTIAAAPASVIVVTDHKFINGTTAQYFAAKNRLPLDISPCWSVPDLVHADLNRFDFVIAKSDLDWVRSKPDGCFNIGNGRQDYARVLSSLDSRRDVFTLVTSTPLPDGSSLLVYRTTAPHASDASATD